MLVIYRKSDLMIEQCVTIAADDYRAMLEADPEIGVIDVERQMSPLDIAVKEVGGVPTVIEKQPMTISGELVGVAGSDIRLTGIPTGTVIISEGQAITMVSSGILDLNFDLPGSYLVSFNHPDYLFQELTVEVSA